jgi:NAD(P)-dependent dehydrogenase (short-subunit alcohol dehydrogenase family)
MAREETGSSFSGRIAVVSGGTQGLGEAVARLFARRGAAGIVICGRDAGRGAAASEALQAAGCPTHFVRADLGDVAACRAVIAAADRDFGRLDALVNAAAITDRGTILDTTPELFDRMMAVNVRGPFFLMQEAARLMRRGGGGGAIVNILSMSAHGGQPFLAAYSASKGALLTLTKNAAFALMPDRIRVNGLTIGWMDTPGEHRIQTEFHHRPPGWLAEVESRQPWGRLLKTDEVARAVAYLASGESGLMSGAIIDFDQQVLGAQEAPPHPAGRLAEVP